MNNISNDHFNFVCCFFFFFNFCIVLLNDRSCFFFWWVCHWCTNMPLAHLGRMDRCMFFFCFFFKALDLFDVRNSKEINDVMLNWPGSISIETRSHVKVTTNAKWMKEKQISTDYGNVISATNVFAYFLFLLALAKYSLENPYDL